MNLIEQMIPFQRQYEEARFAVEIKIYAALYTMPQPKTLEDIYHNLEVLQRLTHERIESQFALCKMERESRYFYDTCGILLVDRANDKKEWKNFILAVDPIS